MRYLVLGLFGLLLSKSFAQDKFWLEADTGRIRMGEQIELTLRASLYGKSNFSWPMLPDSLCEGKVYVVRKLEVDTFQQNPDKPEILLIQQKVYLTSFDSGHYKIGPLSLYLGKDSIISNSIDFRLLTFEVDTSKAFKDIQPIAGVSYNLIDFLRDNPWILLITSIICLLGYLLLNVFLKKKKPLTQLSNNTPIIPPHEHALKKLEHMLGSKKWLIQNSKDYYSDLSDILKEYIEGRYDLWAKEQTTSELMLSLRYVTLPENSWQALKEFFELSDLIKFAKTNVGATESEFHLMLCIRFIKETMPKVENEEKLA